MGTGRGAAARGVVLICGLPAVKSRIGLGLIGVLALGEDRGVMNTSGELGDFFPGELTVLSLSACFGVLGSVTDLSVAMVCG